MLEAALILSGLAFILALVGLYRSDRRTPRRVMEGRVETDAAEPPKRIGAGPREAGTAIENLEERDRT